MIAGLVLLVKAAGWIWSSRGTKTPVLSEAAAGGGCAFPQNGL